MADSPLRQDMGNRMTAIAGEDLEEGLACMWNTDANEVEIVGAATDNVDCIPLHDAKSGEPVSVQLAPGACAVRLDIAAAAGTNIHFSVTNGKEGKWVAAAATNGAPAPAKLIAAGKADDLASAIFFGDGRTIRA